MKKLLAVLFITILNFSCENILPEPPQFCCKINKKQWIPEIKGALGGRNTGLAFYRVNKGFFDIYGSSEKYFVGITIKFPINSEIELNKKYLIEKPIKLNGAGASITLEIDSQIGKDIPLDAINGYIIITKMDSQYFSGTFEYDLEGKVNGKSYKVTKGQFNNMLYAKESN
jgi:hypothetical protein